MALDACLDAQVAGLLPVADRPPFGYDGVQYVYVPARDMSSDTDQDTTRAPPDPTLPSQTNVVRHKVDTTLRKNANRPWACHNRKRVELYSLEK